MRRTKIIATLGPASGDEKTIKALLAAGLDLVRLNFSHGNHREHGRLIELVRRVAAEKGRYVGILQDLGGPKIRCGEIAEPGLQLTAGAEVFLSREPVIGRDGRFSCRVPELLDDLRPGHRIFLDDGLMLLEVSGSDPEGVTCRVINGGLLQSGKGMNLPDTDISLPSLTGRDREDLDFGLARGVDFVALSFVRKAEDILELKELIRSGGRPEPLVIAKIEKPEALENIAAIIEAADAVMIARGDLGIEMRPEQVPVIQKELLQRCRIAGKPAITATQMLDSMIRNPRPTRAEASDVANAVLEGSDCLMLSGETAAGKYPVEATAMMASICRDAEAYMFQNRINEVLPDPGLDQLRYHALAAGIRGITGEKPVKCIAMFTQNGNSVAAFSKFRLEPPLVAFTQKEHTARKLSLFWGASPVLTPGHFDCDRVWEFVKRELVRRKMVEKNDVVLMTYGRPAADGTNTIQMGTIGH